MVTRKRGGSSSPSTANGRRGRIRQRGRVGEPDWLGRERWQGCGCAPGSSEQKPEPSSEKATIVEHGMDEGFRLQTAGLVRPPGTQAQDHRHRHILRRRLLKLETGQDFVLDRLVDRCGIDFGGRVRYGRDVLVRAL